MPLSKRAKLSHPKQEESRSVAADRAAAADDGDDDDDDVEEESDEVEEQEEEEQSEDSDDEERKTDDDEGLLHRSNINKADDDLSRELHSEADRDDDGEEEEVEIVEVVEEDEAADEGEVEEVEEEVEEVVVEEEEEEEEEEDDDDGDEQEEEGEREVGREKEKGGKRSDTDSMEGDAESADDDAVLVKQAHGGDADCQHDARGGVDDANKEREARFVNHNDDLDEEESDEDEDDIDDEEEDGDQCSNDKQLGLEDDRDDDVDLGKQLAVLMCMSSFQHLIAMELCRDTTYPFDEIMREDSNMFSVAFLKLIVLAIMSLMREENGEDWEFQRPGQAWGRIEHGISSIDSATRDSIWRRKYSMSYACFIYVVEELRPFIQAEAHMHVTAPLETERAVAMVLYRLAHGLSAREVAEKYNVGASTVGKYTLIVASALAEASKLYGRYIAIPTGNRIARIISQFQEITNVSQVCGAIGSSHIKLYIKPDKWSNSSANQSPPKLQSVLLQAVCDANKLFWDVCCMAPGSAHEAANFVTSNLYQKVTDGLSLQKPVLILENREVTPLMVANHSYPLRPFVIKPFDMDDALRKAFDEQLQKGLACVDAAFVILKTRWRVLRCMNVRWMHAPRIAVACCVLHNICQLWGEPEPPHEQLEQCISEHSHDVAAAYEIDEASRMAGETTREALFRDWVKRSLDSPYVPAEHENVLIGQT